MKRRMLRLVPLLLAAALPFVFIESPVLSRVAAITLVCLYLWLSELVPPFVPSLMIWAAVPLLLAPVDPKFSLSNVLGWAADPVMALFFSGFAIGLATERLGFDKRLAGIALKASNASFARMLFLMIGLTAFLSMWMSNIAAAALIFAVVRPLLACRPADDITRRTMLVGIALGADLGGMATPIGTGPNAIAIAWTAPSVHISFVNWMIFAFPLTIGMLLFGFVLLLWRSNAANQSVPAADDFVGRLVEDSSSRSIGLRGKFFLAITAATVGLWLTEPLHGIPSAVIAISAASILFLSGILRKRDLMDLDWSTLLLIAGGITLGRLLDSSGAVQTVANGIPFSEMNATVGLFVLCMTSALLSALMSNTASVVMLIPLASALMPEPSTAILVAISASFGLPFVISTPPNAMAFGEGGLRSSDLFGPGIVLMLVGCLLVSLTGRAVLNFAGIP